MSSRRTCTGKEVLARGEPRVLLARAVGLTVALLSLAPLSCGGERAVLLRGQSYYDDNQYERALSVWRALERQEAELTPEEFARYAYLRGMTDYRLGFHADARHWLALAKVSEQASPGGLELVWLPRLDSALADLDQETFGLPEGNKDAVQSIEAVQSIDAPAVPPGVRSQPPSAEPPPAGPASRAPLPDAPPASEPPPGSKQN